MVVLVVVFVLMVAFAIVAVVGAPIMISSNMIGVLGRPIFKIFFWPFSEALNRVITLTTMKKWFENTTG